MDNLTQEQLKHGATLQVDRMRSDSLISSSTIGYTLVI